MEGGAMVKPWCRGQAEVGAGGDGDPGGTEATVRLRTEVEHKGRRSQT